MSEFDEDCISIMMAAHRDGVLRFLKWCETNWLHDTREQWRHEEAFPGDEFVEGWNSAIEGMRLAFDCYAEDVLG